MGDYERGQALFEASLAVNRELGDKRGIAVLLGNLGTNALRQRDFERARTLLEESLALRREMGERRGVGYMLRCLSAVASSQGDYARAQTLLAESLTFAREPGGHTNELASVLCSQGHVARLQGDLKQARSLLKETFLLLQASRPEPDSVAESLEELAPIEHGEKRSERAASLFGAAEKMREEISSPMSPLKRQEYEQCVREVRASLGEAAFATAWEKGRQMTGAQAVAYALEAGGPDPGADG
jgi:tetratricopeptide (TPR) repeat protein